MDNLVCTDCGITYYSAAARLMVERGERCDCGAPLRERDDRGVPVAMTADLAGEAGKASGASEAREARRANAPNGRGRWRFRR